ncbi:TATDN1 [Symbiodinium natans]|uniref:TATDN1 protein n=1 Tax=Symbiodinium natans TaxID=878477 RepID=A0A812R582_9DINO|nr:TATDN1 [Symbiodinium natans]
MSASESRFDNGALEEQRRWSASGMFRNTWQRMNEWGDEIERRHFDGNFVGSLVGAPMRAGQVMNEWGDDFERRHFEGDFLSAVSRAPVAAGEVLSEAIGQIVDSSLELPVDSVEPWMTPGFDAEAFVSFHPTAAMEDAPHVEEARGPSPPSPAAPDVPSSEHSPEHSPARSERRNSSSSTGGRTVDEVAAFMSSLPDGAEMERVAEELQVQLHAEQAKRQGRYEALRALKVALLQLPREAAQEKGLADEAAGARAEAAARACAAQRALQALKENHQQLQEKLEAQVDQREQLEAAAAAARAAVERAAQLAASACREWARDGPETDALKSSKIELAELLAELDEARLHRRRELKALQQEVETLERENQWFRSGGHDQYEAPASFTASLRKLFKVAIGKGDAPDSTPTSTSSPSA